MSAAPVFWAVALALLALTLAVLLWPLVRRRGVQAPSEDAARTSVYRDQKRQLDDDLAAGVLSAADHATGVDELTRRLGVELDAAATAPPEPAHARLGFVAALAVVAIIPAGAIVLYLALGTPDALRAPGAAATRPSEQEIVGMVESLAAKMKANPADPRGWRLLGRSYAALGRYDESSAAYEQAIQRGGEDPDVLADWAEAMALGHGRTVSGEPERLAARALALRPDHPKALALLATAAVERRDFDGSIALWRRLQVTLPPGSEDALQTQAAIAEIERIRAGAPKDPRGASVSGQVEIAPSLAARAAPGDTLYIFARANGVRMPLAVLRTDSVQWPRAFELDDSMSMGGGAKLSTAPAVTVEARLSRSGDATPHAGDLEGRSSEVKPGARGVRVVLDHVVP